MNIKNCLKLSNRRKNGKGRKLFKKIPDYFQFFVSKFNLFREKFICFLYKKNLVKYFNIKFDKKCYKIFINYYVLKPNNALPKVKNVKKHSIKIYLVY